MSAADAAVWSPLRRQNDLRGRCIELERPPLWCFHSGDTQLATSARGELSLEPSASTFDAMPVA